MRRIPFILRYPLKFGFLLVASYGLQAQTCCSGGVPLSSNLGLPPSAGNTIQLNLSYDLNTLSTLKTGVEELDDDSRRRQTHSVLFQVGYSLSDRFAVDAFFSWVRQTRQISQFGNTNFVGTDGIGDAVVLLKHKTLASPGNHRIWTNGLGVKAPTGASNLRREDGLPIVADLQPGSGAWDGILWSQYTQVAGFRPSMSFTATATYSFKGTNDEYLGSQRYKFGNEFVFIGGVSDRLLLGSAVIDPSLVVRYRQVAADIINDQTMPNTGGQWIFLNPGLTYWLTPDLSLNTNVELPLIADITGTQVTPTYRLNTGIFYRLSFGKNNNNTINPLR